MKKLESLPSDTVVIEDGDHGVAAAISAGARVVKVSNPGEVSLELIDRIMGEAT